MRNCRIDFRKLDFNPVTEFKARVSVDVMLEGRFVGQVTVPVEGHVMLEGRFVGQVTVPVEGHVIRQVDLEKAAESKYPSVRGKRYELFFHT